MDSKGNRHLATDKTVQLKPVFMINNRMIYIEKAGAVNTNVKIRLGMLLHTSVFPTCTFLLHTRIHT